MVTFDSFTLSNGLRFFVHRDVSSPIVAMNVLYDVGARDEHPDQTGFAHLFEHLMFGGSVNIPRYDEPLQMAGGQNNAFTNSDITNYYLTLPAQNIETAFWLESDRMLNLAFSAKSLEVQRQVVVEEFRQNYLNQPYGDAWFILRPLAYKVHPYQWSTIGKEISHIEKATMEDVKSFYARFYNPNNAIVSIVGNVETHQAQKLAEKWFTPIPAGPVNRRLLPAEPQQTQARFVETKQKVPAHAIYKAWHIPAYLEDEYFALSLAANLLASGRSSILYRELVMRKSLFAEISAFTTGNLDPGLFVISGKVMPGVDFDKAVTALNETLMRFLDKKPSPSSLQKVKNKMETIEVFDNISVLDKAMNLAMYAHLGDANLINTISRKYRDVQAQELYETTNLFLNESNCSTLYYLKEDE
ncbi:MAG: insulinase family protein [Bacteroidales bacterium]|nr:insulinase family protein [Bacteroidales bacterium]